MQISAEKKAHLKEVAKEETRNFISLFLYLALILCSFQFYRHLVLAEYHIQYARVGYGLIQALILAKVVMIGEAMHIGSLFGNAPRILVILFKTVVFSLFVMVFAAGEHFVEGLFEHESISQIWAAFIAQGKDEILGRVLLMVVSFIPMFALIELAQGMGEKGIHRVFLQRPGPRKDAETR